MTKPVDVVVVGGGLVGAALAFELCTAGLRTTLVDRHDRGRATDAGAGILSPETIVTDDAAWHALAMASADHYRQLIPELAAIGAPDTGYTRCGLLRLAFREWDDDLFATSREQILGRGPEAVRDVDPAEAQAMFPPLGPVRNALSTTRTRARIDGRLATAALLRTDADPRPRRGLRVRHRPAARRAPRRRGRDRRRHSPVRRSGRRRRSLDAGARRAARRRPADRPGPRADRPSPPGRSRHRALAHPATRPQPLRRGLARGTGRGRRDRGARRRVQRSPHRRRDAPAAGRAAPPCPRPRRRGLRRGPNRASAGQRRRRPSARAASRGATTRTSRPATEPTVCCSARTRAGSSPSCCSGATRRPISGRSHPTGSPERDPPAGTW